MARKLATIQIVKSVEPVITRDGVPADNLELIKFYNIGWQCVAKKGEFEPMHAAVYIEISTVLPDHPVFEFMRAKGFKVKTQKFVGTTLSQGLALPINILFEHFGATCVQAGEDVTEMIGVTRYDPETFDVKMSGLVAGRFPEHIVPKTDQERIQSAPYILEVCRGIGLVATLKIDGTSGTFYLGEDEQVHACSRNFEQKPDNGTVYWYIAKKYNLQKFFEANPHLVLQGEITGPGIQKNRLDLKDKELFVFDIWDRRENEYLTYSKLQDLCEEGGLPYVELVTFPYTGGTKYNTIDELLELAKGYYDGTKNHREGIVVRPYYKTLYDARFGRVTFKVINNDYLLKGGE